MLGDILVKLGLITEDQLKTALDYQASHGGFLGRILIKLGFIKGMELVRALALQEGLTPVEIDSSFLIDPELTHLIPETDAVQNLLLPLVMVKNTLFLAVPPTVQKSVILRLAEGMESQIEPIFISDIPLLKKAIETAYKRDKEGSVHAQKIGAFLRDRGLITGEQLEKALLLQKETGHRLGKILVEQGFLSEFQFFSALSKNLNIPLLSTTDIYNRLDPSVAALCSRAFASKNLVIPFSRTDTTLNLLVTDPNDKYVVDVLKKVANRNAAQLYLAMESTLSMVINSAYNPTGKVEVPVVEVEDVTEVDRLDLLAGHKDPDIPKILNYLLYKGITERVSDIHIECYEDRAQVRFRIDGVLHTIQYPLISLGNINRIISKLKIDAKLDIAERRKPQDGAFRKRFGRQKLIDFRLAVQPTLYGESAVIRILDQEAKIPTLESLGFSDEILRRYSRYLNNPHGLILVTGPTGSGKSTTLYSTMNLLKQNNNKIITAEDPIEYSVDGIQQCQVFEQIGNTFANYLRAFLRQDPDVILVGEIRDSDTAEMAVRAALTGHLVFSTLHVNDALGVIRRLEDLGLEPNLISQSLLCVISQRLVRKICRNCLREDSADEELVAEFYPHGTPQGIRFYKGEGCPQCNHTGYRGRVGIIEFWDPDEESKEMINTRTSINLIRPFAINNGMTPLSRDGLEKVEKGITTLSELKSVIPWEEIRRIRELYV